MIDPKTFLDTTIDTAMDTRLIPMDLGEYTGITGEPEIRQWQSKEGDKSGFKLVLPITIDDAGQKEKTGRDTLRVFYEAMLDTMPGGGLDLGKGKNVRLGALREAVGLNVPGQTFNMRMLSGRPLKVAVGQDTYEGVIRNVVKAVTRL